MQHTIVHHIQNVGAILADAARVASEPVPAKNVDTPVLVADIATREHYRRCALDLHVPAGEIAQRRFSITETLAQKIDEVRRRVEAREARSAGDR